jgi:integrase
LEAFDRFCLEFFPNETVLSKEIAMHWAEKRPDEHVNGLMRRITPVRQLAKYMNSIGIDAYIIPVGIPGKQIHYVPHIYTDQELRAFFAALDQCEPNPHSPARHLTIPVFFPLLYCCGLRSSEARMLNIEDVDLETGKLTIRNSKGNKDRIVMMSKDVLYLCCKYHSMVSHVFPIRVAFFPNQCGNHYNNKVVDYWFHLFWNKTGITNMTGGNPPRVHDFRHTFAVKRLNLWVQEGKDLNTFLPYLSIYLGHAHLTETDYYLHLIPDFFPLFRAKTLEKCANLIPEVKNEG